MSDLKQKLIELAQAEGADLLSVAPVVAYDEYLESVRERMRETDADHTDFMVPKNHPSFFKDLSNIKRIFPEAKSIVLLGVYALDTQNGHSDSFAKRQGRTAKTYYYYPVVRMIAEKLAAFIERQGYRAIQGQQIPLKYAAVQTGMGAYGQNGLLYTTQFGSFVALRAVITDAALDPDSFEPPELECDDCGRCVKACPTGALYAPYKVNPKRCINPLSRREEPIPDELQKRMSNWVCGCDVCQDVCPMNRKLTPREPDSRACFDAEHHASHRMLAGLERCPDLEQLAGNASNPLMQRNARIALRNLGA